MIGYNKNTYKYDFIFTKSSVNKNMVVINKQKLFYFFTKIKFYFDVVYK